ncbi:hypothetical protein Tco_0379378 [Tanacetum coccineum]
MDHLNPLPPTSNSEPEDVIEVEDTIESKDKTVPASVHKVDLGNEVRSSMEQGTAAMKKLVEKLGNAGEKAECKKLKKELKEARFSDTFLRIQNERVERDLYWTRVRAHEFYREMIRRGFVFEERPNEAIDVPVEDENSPSSESRGSPPAIRQMIKESVDAAIAAERARHANARNDARGSGLVRGQDVALAIQGKKVKFAVVTLQEPALTWWNAKVATMGLKTVKEYNIVAYTQRFNELALMCPKMVKPESVKVDAYIQGLTNNIKGEVTSSKPANMNEVISMTTDPTDGKVSSGSLPVCERCFTRHVGPCTIKYHKCGKVGYKARGLREPMPRKVKQEETREVRGRGICLLRMLSLEGFRIETRK